MSLAFAIRRILTTVLLKMQLNTQNMLIKLNKNSNTQDLLQAQTTTCLMKTLLHTLEITLLLYNRDKHA